MRAHFAIQHLRFTFDGQIGRGANGLAFRLVERTSSTRSRKLVVKRALPGREEDLRNEISYLKKLRGAEHVVALVASRDERAPRERDRQRRSLEALAGRRLGLRNALEGIAGPVAVLEYMEHGNIEKIYSRCMQTDTMVPNRVLWALFLCLIRACIALAYPIGAEENAQTRLETIPTDGTGPSKIEHADLHGENIMIGEVDGFVEHQIVPPFKFIDFGRTRDVYGTNIPDNVWKISRMMIEMATHSDVRISRNITQYNGYETRATEILPHGNGAKYPNLDPDLCDFLARCLADKPQDRPDLQVMLDTAETAVRIKTAAAYPGNPSETDEAIAQFLQTFIYDAEIRYESA
ncbi:hypothetical protein GGR53DRAFT_97566 [Hypoxylon sp. FL1150]|nr:hypothetical protein GGR53DRAFT_97566 [Hypoxylon sp. FL1150]